jgi:hypothetical protein
MNSNPQNRRCLLFDSTPNLRAAATCNFPFFTFTLPLSAFSNRHFAQLETTRKSLKTNARYDS